MHAAHHGFFRRPSQPNDPTAPPLNALARFDDEAMSDRDRDEVAILLLQVAGIFKAMA